MKNTTHLIASLLLLAAFVNAKPVLKNTAATVAGNYYSQTYNAIAGDLTLVYTEYSSNGEPVYYVFDAANNNGFIIVSAEDVGHPIIGSSNTGHFVIPTSNNNVAFWMNRRKKQIISMRAHNVSASSNIAGEWNAYINNVPRTHKITTNVTPLLTGLQWDQQPYYNSMCPDGSVTGCVATAMTQIMRYWKYPSVGAGSNCYDDETSQGFQENYGQLCAEFDTTHYNWAAMPNSVNSTNNEVAKLMYDCGISINTDYSPSGSGAYLFAGSGPCAQTAYVQYFKYNSATIQGVYQSSYSSSAWIALIANEQASGRPVQFQGIDSNHGGHSWVCDGYNTNNEFHMNWGWGGNDNGYFMLDSLAVNAFDFSEDVGAIIGIEPPSNTLGVNQISDDKDVSVYPNPSHGVFTFSIPTSNTTYKVNIYNILGQEVNTARINSVSNTINVSNQAKGIYVYKIISETDTDEPTSTGRLVVE
jgi:hypothetical protein